MANYLFTLTITPVQSFISQARKTKDLFAGSEILSNLMKEVIGSEVLTSQKFELIYPYFNKDEDKSSFPNKIVISFENITQDGIEKIGQKLEEFINNKFYKNGLSILIKTVREINLENMSGCNSKIKIDNDFVESYFKPQLCNFFQIFWVAVELKDAYQESYKKLEQSLGAIKNLRTFEQLRQCGYRKCSICGERNGLFYNRNKKLSFLFPKAINIQNNKAIDENETLCAVCFTKRFYIDKENKNSYPSTADIVMLNRKNELNGEDAHLYLEEKYSGKKKSYALIHFDIDDMGKTLSGLNRMQQEKLSEVLGEFSQKAKEVVNKNGETIYAGGDDFLGFVNLEYLFDVIEEIQKIFSYKVRDYEVENEKIFSSLTYSTSILIAHYKAPLHKVLDFSRELLDITKKYFGDEKNGVGIMVISSNAINAQTICKYEDLELLNDMREKKIGMNLHYKLKSIFRFFDENTLAYIEYEYQIKMLEYEIKRLLEREQGNFNDEIYKKLIDFLHRQVNNLNTENKIIIDFDNFIGYLKTLEQLKKVI